ncbi:hypothetical protein [Buchananella felis]|uniref:hypothetical protein n=1 Tax=Buchananella felis TaxID=3231492 RepID=UPI0035271780
MKAANRVAGAASALLALGLLAGCADDVAAPPAPAPTVESYVQPDAGLTAALTEGQEVRIGVLVGPVEGAGAEFRPLVEGANLAAYRFALVGADVSLEVALDDGTASGAASAVKSLLDKGVSGIVVASQADSHLSDALKLANAAGSAVISLYSAATDAEVWSLAADSGALSQAAADALAGANAKKPFVALAPSRQAPVDGARLATIDDVAKTADAIKAAVDAREVDSVVVSAPAAQSAALVTALDARLGGAQIPILVSAEAVTPSFGEAVLAAGAAEGRLLTVGTTSVDLTALSPGEDGSAASAFFTSMRLAMGDADCMNLYRDDPCSQSMHLADAASHDAVVALVRAVEAAGSTEPAAVREALAGLSLSTADGLAGGSLDFRSKSALPASELKTLHASTANPGMRPVPAGQQGAHSLFWFSE